MTRPLKGPKNWSISAVQLYEQCPAAFKRRHINHEYETGLMPTFVRRGTVGHAGLEAAWRRRLETRGHGPMWTEENWEAAKAAIEAEWRRQEMPPPEASNGDWDYVHAAVETTLRAESEAWEHIAGVEHQFFLRCGMNLKGFADLIRRPEPTVVHIRDWKFRKSPTSPEALQNDLQGQTYGEMAFRTLPDVEVVRFSHYNPPIGSEVVVELRRADTKAGLARVRATRDLVQYDKTFATNKGEHCDRCVYKPSCPAWPAEVVTAPTEESVADLNRGMF